MFAFLPTRKQKRNKKIKRAKVKINPVDFDYSQNQRPDETILEKMRRK